MKNIKEFKSGTDLDLYINSKKKKFIQSGTEGEVYTTKDNNIIKYMKESYRPKYLSESKDIIMSSDIKLDSFIFPDELFVIDDQIVGYISDYFEGNILRFPNSKVEKEEELNLEALIEARYKMIEDIKELTDMGYYLFDLPMNILFDNKKLCAIDTLDYRKDLSSDLLKKNLKFLDYALAFELCNHTEDNNISLGDDFDTVIQKIKKRR